MARFAATPPTGAVVQELEGLVGTALFKPAASPVSTRQIQRVVQRVGHAVQQWQQRLAQSGVCDAPILYVSADGTGVSMVTEALAGRRGKQAGMFGSKPGDENILAFRCIHSSRRLDEFWKYRLNTHAARNVSLPLAA